MKFYQIRSRKSSLFMFAFGCHWTIEFLPMMLTLFVQLLRKVFHWGHVIRSWRIEMTKLFQNDILDSDEILKTRKFLANPQEKKITETSSLRLFNFSFHFPLLSSNTIKEKNHWWLLLKYYDAVCKNHQNFDIIHADARVFC